MAIPSIRFSTRELALRPGKRGRPPLETESPRAKRAREAKQRLVDQLLTDIGPFTDSEGRVNLTQALTANIPVERLALAFEAKDIRKAEAGIEERSIRIGERNRAQERAAQARVEAPDALAAPEDTILADHRQDIFRRLEPFTSPVDDGTDEFNIGEALKQRKVSVRELQTLGFTPGEIARASRFAAGVAAPGAGPAPDVERVVDLGPIRPDDDDQNLLSPGRQIDQRRDVVRSRVTQESVDQEDRIAGGLPADRGLLQQFIDPETGGVFVIDALRAGVRPDELRRIGISEPDLADAIRQQPLTDSERAALGIPPFQPDATSQPKSRPFPIDQPKTTQLAQDAEPPNRRARLRALYDQALNELIERKTELNRKAKQQILETSAQVYDAVEGGANLVIDDFRSRPVIIDDQIRELIETGRIEGLGDDVGVGPPVGGTPVFPAPGLIPFGGKRTAAVAALALAVDAVRRNPELLDGLDAKRRNTLRSVAHEQVRPGDVSPPGFPLEQPRAVELDNPNVRPDLGLEGVPLLQPPTGFESPPPFPRELQPESEVSKVRVPQDITKFLSVAADYQDAVNAAAEGVVSDPELSDRAKQDILDALAAGESVRLTNPTHRQRISEAERKRIALESATSALVASQGFSPQEDNPVVIQGSLASAAVVVGPQIDAELVLGRLEALSIQESSLTQPQTVTAAEALADLTTRNLTAEQTRRLVNTAERLQTRDLTQTLPLRLTATLTAPLPGVASRVVARPLTTTRTRTAARTAAATRAAALPATAAPPTTATTVPIAPPLGVPDRDAEDDAPLAGRRAEKFGINRGVLDTSIDLTTGESSTVPDIAGVPEVPTRASVRPLRFGDEPTREVTIPWGIWDVSINPLGDLSFDKKPAKRKPKSGRVRAGKIR